MSLNSKCKPRVGHGHGLNACPCGLLVNSYKYVTLSKFVVFCVCMSLLVWSDI